MILLNLLAYTHDMTIFEITPNDFTDWLEMAIDLWPEEQPEDMPEILLGLQKDPKNKNFICRSDTDEAIGFINLSIRTDYVEGSDSSPVGYVEGVYVKPAYRGSGIGKALIKHGETWAKSQGCQEMGSDAYVDNMQSREFHKKAGFAEAGIIVAFIKKIE